MRAKRSSPASELSAVFGCITPSFQESSSDHCKSRSVIEPGTVMSCSAKSARCMTYLCSAKFPSRPAVWPKG